MWCVCTRCAAQGAHARIAAYTTARVSALRTTTSHALHYTKVVKEPFVFCFPLKPGGPTSGIFCFPSISVERFWGVLSRAARENILVYFYGKIGKNRARSAREINLWRCFL